MKLHLNRTSPFARVARIVALEKGLGEHLELCWSDPWADEAALLAANPVGRVPVLVTAEGACIAESLLIALYLDGQSAHHPLLLAATLAATLQLVGLGQGLMEAAFNRVIARKHEGPAADHSLLGQRRLRAIERSLTALPPLLAADEPGLSLGHIVLAVALDYLAFRLPEIPWQQQPALLALHQRLSARPSFQASAFA
jgi:glutathione S-transferase